MSVEIAGVGMCCPAFVTLGTIANWGTRTPPSYAQPLPARRGRLAVGQPSDVKFDAWSAPPPNAAMLVFGNLGSSGSNVTVQGWLYDVKNPTTPQVLAKQYTDAAVSKAVRVIAHKFADEIIFRQVADAVTACVGDRRIDLDRVDLYAERW